MNIVTRGRLGMNIVSKVAVERSDQWRRANRRRPEVSYKNYLVIDTTGDALRALTYTGRAMLISIIGSCGRTKWVRYLTLLNALYNIPFTILSSCLFIKIFSLENINMRVSSARPNGCRVRSFLRRPTRRNIYQIPTNIFVCIVSKKKKQLKFTYIVTYNYAVLRFILCVFKIWFGVQQRRVWH